MYGLHIPISQNGNCHNYCCENLKSHNNLFCRTRPSALLPTHILEDQVTEFISLSDRVAWGSLLIAFYYSQGYGGYIATLTQLGN
jgi:hypothetical protein